MGDAGRIYTLFSELSYRDANAPSGKIPILGYSGYLEGRDGPLAMSLCAASHAVEEGWNLTSIRLP